MSKFHDIARKSSRQESRMDSLMTPPSGITSEHSTGDPGLDSWILSLRATRVSPTVPQENERVQTTSETCGPTRPESSERSDPLTSSWRMLRESYGIISTESGQSYRSWATSLRRDCAWRLRRERRITGRGFYVLPTPQAFDQYNWARQPRAHTRQWGGYNTLSQMALGGKLSTPVSGVNAKNNASASKMFRYSMALNAQVGGALSPRFVEWMMGLPIGWTDLKPLEMGSYQGWWQSFSKG